MKYLFHLAYKGSNYSGWQWQKNAITIQQQIEETLSKVLKSKTTIHGCGRTDAGVHASQYFFHTVIKEILSDDFLYIFNKNLPSDISIYEYFIVRDDFNAQLDASSREYKYYIHRTKNPFISENSTLVLGELDLDKIQDVLNLLPGKKDFRAYTLRPEKQDSTICKLDKCEMKIFDKGNKICISFKGNRFIRGMVRLLVGNILEVAKGKMSLSLFEAHLNDKTAPKFSKLARPQGLYLSSVKYDGLSIETKTQ